MTSHSENDAPGNDALGSDVSEEGGGVSLSDIGHLGLDVVGFVPGWGEPADLANAAWYATEGEYLDAGLSLLSLAPIVGDVLGKGGRVAKNVGGAAAKKFAKALQTVDFEKVLGPLRSNEQLGPHIDKIIEALKKWRKEMADDIPDCTPSGMTRCPGVKAPPTTRISKTEVPNQYLNLTSKERKAFEKALKEIEEAPMVPRKDKAVFYSGKVNGGKAWELAEDAAAKGEYDSISTLTENVLNKPEYRKTIPADTMGFLDVMASRKLAQNASGDVTIIGDVSTIRKSSVFRNIELPKLLNNPKISNRSKKHLLEIKQQLDAIHGPLP